VAAHDLLHAGHEARDLEVLAHLELDHRAGAGAKAVMASAASRSVLLGMVPR